HGGVAVAEDHRPPRTDVVDIALAFGVEDAGAFGAGDESRRAADRAERAHRRVHAARDHALGALEQALVAHRIQWMCRVPGDSPSSLPPSAPGSPSSPSSGGSAQKKRSGITLPMPGRKPASSD